MARCTGNTVGPQRSRKLARGELDNGNGGEDERRRERHHKINTIGSSDASQAGNAFRSSRWQHVADRQVQNEQRIPIRPVRGLVQPVT
jgi:hypothetical protein